MWKPREGTTPHSSGKASGWAPALRGGGRHVDCEPCVIMMHVGQAVSTGGKHILARIVRLLFSVFDEFDTHCIRMAAGSHEGARDRRKGHWQGS